MSRSLKSKILTGLRIILGLAFVGATAMKWTGQPRTVAEFGAVGLGQWFRYVTRVIELLGELLIVREKAVAWGALLSLCVAAGAFFCN